MWNVSTGYLLAKIPLHLTLYRPNTAEYHVMAVTMPDAVEIILTLYPAVTDQSLLVSQISDIILALLFFV